MPFQFSDTFLVSALILLTLTASVVTLVFVVRLIGGVRRLVDSLSRIERIPSEIKSAAMVQETRMDRAIEDLRREHSTLMAFQSRLVSSIFHSSEKVGSIQEKLRSTNPDDVAEATGYLATMSKRMEERQRERDDKRRDADAKNKGPVVHVGPSRAATDQPLASQKAVRE